MFQSVLKSYRIVQKLRPFATTFPSKCRGIHVTPSKYFFDVYLRKFGVTVYLN